MRDEESYCFIPPGHAGKPRPLRLWESQTQADSLNDAQFEPVSVLSYPATIEMVDLSLRAYSLDPASEPKLTKPEEVQ